VSIEDRQWLIGVMRPLRAGMALLGVMFVALAWWDVTGLHKWWLAPQMVIMALVMAGTVIFATRVIRLNRAWLNERGD
jgi:membrane protein YdbS with pleckstrin-like domain